MQANLYVREEKSLSDINAMKSFGKNDLTVGCLFNKNHQTAILMVGCVHVRISPNMLHRHHHLLGEYLTNILDVWRSEFAGPKDSKVKSTSNSLSKISGQAKPVPLQTPLSVCISKGHQVPRISWAQTYSNGPWSYWYPCYK